MATKREICEEEGEDRLSYLPQDLQLCILSSLDVKYAVQTSTLSRSWIPLWTCIPVLEFNCSAFNHLPVFRKFVKKVLSLRDQSASLHRLSITSTRFTSGNFIKKVVNYAFTYSVKELEIDVPQLNKSFTWPICDLHASSCESLTRLKLQTIGTTSCPFLGPRSGQFKNLSVLFLQGALIDDLEPFLGFPVLESLTLFQCDISTTGKTLNVHGRNLLDLAISYCRGFDCCKITTPKLRFFEYQGQWSGLPKFTTHEDLPNLDTMVIDFHSYGDMHDQKRNFDNLLSLFCVFDTAKSIRLLPGVLALLSLFKNELVHRNLPLRNLECLMLYFSDHPHWLSFKQRFWIASKLKAYLLQNSSNAKFTIIYPEDIFSFYS